MPAARRRLPVPRPLPQPDEAAGADEDRKALVGDNVRKTERCCGESGTLGVTRPDIATQVRFRKEEELRKDEAALRASGAVGDKDNIKILTSCPSCLQGLTRYGDDLQNGLLEADYIVVEMAKPDPRRELDARLRARGQRRRHRARAGLSAALDFIALDPAAAHDRAAHRPRPVHQASRVLEVGFRRRRELPHPVRADARVFAVGRGAGPRPGPGGAADRQARRRIVDARAGRPLRACSRRFTDGHDTGIFSWDYLYHLGRSRPSCGSATKSAWQPPAPTATRRWPAPAARRGLRPSPLTRSRHEQDPLRLRDASTRRDKAQPRARRLRFGRAALRPDERPDVARPAPRLEGLHGGGGRRAARPTGARHRRRHRRPGAGLRQQRRRAAAWWCTPTSTKPCCASGATACSTRAWCCPRVACDAETAAVSATTASTWSASPSGCAT